MNKNKARKGIWMDIAVLIVCLAIATSSLASGVFAKFTTQSEGGGEAGRAAAFEVDATLNTAQYAVDLSSGNKTGSYTLTISNDSETPVSCTVKIVFAAPVGEFVTARMYGRTGIVDSTGTTFTFENVKILAPGETDAPAIDLTVDPARYNAASTSKDFDFNVNVIFSQID